ncbi:MAG TPA: 2-dehydropantoate 2-reductase [Opitutaceae bacterium]|nr:2-dehydropantoate 2-reductase [Opitutaceae bacterium]
MAKIAVIGPGAIGGVMAAWLAHSGEHEVVLCARRPLPQLTVQTPSTVLRIEKPALTDPGQASPVDWILVATKAYDAAGAASWFKGLGAGKAPVAVLQNGIEHRERFAAYVPADRVVPVVVECPVERDDPTRIRQRRNATLTMPNDALGTALAALFRRTEVTANPIDDFQTAVWRKLCLNCAGVIPGILLQPAGIFHREAAARAAAELVRECAAVGRAEGAKLAPDIAEQIVAHYRGQPRDSVNSLHADRMAGRRTEIDARNGVIIRLGEKHGIPTPFNRMAVALIEAVEPAS